MSDSARYEDLIRKAYTKIQRLEEELDAIRTQQGEPLAVVGLSCRLPGAATPAEFWRVLRDGVDTIREVPPDRWDVGSYYSPHPDAPGKTYARHGGFLDGIEMLDHAFFGISPREAITLDPQQRLLLEVSWECSSMRGSPPINCSGAGPRSSSASWGVIMASS